MFGVPFPLESLPRLTVWMGNAVGCRLIRQSGSKHCLYLEAYLQILMKTQREAGDSGGGGLTPQWGPGWAMLSGATWWGLESGGLKALGQNPRSQGTTMGPTPKEGEPAGAAAALL